MCMQEFLRFVVLVVWGVLWAYPINQQCQRVVIGLKVTARHAFLQDKSEHILMI